jgi:hypothetical protein
LRVYKSEGGALRTRECRFFLFDIMALPLLVHVVPFVALLFAAVSADVVADEAEESLQRDDALYPSQWLYSALKEKRRPISINQDLMALSRMVEGDKAQQAHNFLSLIGKRDSPEVYRYRRSGRLSVGMPLDTLSGMIQAQRRRQFVDKAANVHNKLMNIGKRSVDELLFES